MMAWITATGGKEATLFLIALNEDVLHVSDVFLLPLGFHLFPCVSPIFLMRK